MLEGNKNVNGERQISANPGANWGAFYNDLPRDFYAQCSVRSASSDSNCAVTFMFHGLIKDGLIVTNHGIYLGPGLVLFASARDGKVGPAPWQALPSGIYPDARQNTIVGLEVIGSEVRLFINNQCVTSFTIQSPSEGRGFTLAVSSTGQVPCTAYFDNLKIYAASTAANDAKMAPGSKTSGEKKAKTGGEKKAKTGVEKKAKFDTRNR
jgi:hypothetical protein